MTDIIDFASARARLRPAAEPAHPCKLAHALSEQLESMTYGRVDEARALHFVQVTMSDWHLCDLDFTVQTLRTQGRIALADQIRRTTENLRASCAHPIDFQNAATQLMVLLRTV